MHLLIKAGIVGGLQFLFYDTHHTCVPMQALVQFRWRPAAWEMRHSLCLPSWHAGPQLPTWSLHVCKVQPFTPCQVSGLSVPLPRIVSAVALWSPITNVLQNECILQQVDTLIYCFLGFQHILYYQRQADAAKISFIWVMFLGRLHTVKLISAKIWTQLAVCWFFFFFSSSFQLLTFQAQFFLQRVLQKSFQSRQAICRNGN